MDFDVPDLEGDEAVPRLDGPLAAETAATTATATSSSLLGVRPTEPIQGRALRSQPRRASCPISAPGEIKPQRIYSPL